MGEKDRTGFGRRAMASIEVTDDNGYHDSTIKQHCPLDNYPHIPLMPLNV